MTLFKRGEIKNEVSSKKILLITLVIGKIHC